MRHGYTLKQIADHLHLNYTTVSKAVKELEKTNLYSKTPFLDLRFPIGIDFV